MNGEVSLTILKQNVHSKPKGFWQYINSSINTCLNQSVPMVLQLVSSDSEMTTLFNDYISLLLLLKILPLLPKFIQEVLVLLIY